MEAEDALRRSHHASKSRPRLSQAELANFKLKGYVVLRGLLSEHEADALCSDAMVAWAATKTGVSKLEPETQTWLQSSLLPDVHHHSRRIRDFYWSGPLIDIASTLIGSHNIKGATAQLTFKLKGNTKAFGWHQDNGYGHLEPYSSVSCLVALDDTHEENGCLRVVPGSSHGGQLTALTAEMKKAGVELVVEVDESTSIPVPMRKGDVLIMHCHTLHASGPNRTDAHRRLLFLRYADADAVEVFNEGKPRLGRLVCGTTRFPEVESFEVHLSSDLDLQLHHARGAGTRAPETPVVHSGTSSARSSRGGIAPRSRPRSPKPRLSNYVVQCEQDMVRSCAGFPGF